MRANMRLSMIGSVLSFLVFAGDLEAGECEPVTCDNAPAWQQGVKYKKGDRVISVRGNLWECKKTSSKCGCLPEPEGLFCGRAFMRRLFTPSPIRTVRESSSAPYSFRGHHACR